MSKVNQHHREGLEGIHCGPGTYYPIAWEDLHRYGDWTDDARGPWLVPGGLSGSDYSGGLVAKSNACAWREAFDASEGDWWREVSGGHGTFAIVVKTAEMPDEALEFLCALSDYPIADDDLHCRMEIEARGEAWENFYAREFERALAPIFAEAWEADQEERRAELARYGVCPLAIWPEAEGTDAPEFEPTGDKLYAIFASAMEIANVYWEDSEGEGMGVNIARVVEVVDPADLLAAMVTK